jgi:hypothetical protein
MTSHNVTKTIRTYEIRWPAPTASAEGGYWICLEKRQAILAGGVAIEQKQSSVFARRRNEMMSTQRW